MLTACGLTTPVTVTIASVPEYVLYVFFQISKHVTFYVFRMDVSKSRKKSSAKFSKQSFKMSSHTSLSNHCNSSGFFIDISKQMAFEIKELAGYTLTLLHSKMFDVCDLPVLTFGNCVLKTGVTKWPPKLFFVTFFQNPKTRLFYVFGAGAHVFSNAGYRSTYCYKKLSYRRVTARCVLSVVILPITTQQCRNYLYDKS